MNISVNEYDGCGHLPLKDDGVDVEIVENDVRKAAHDIGLFKANHNEPYTNKDFYVRCEKTEVAFKRWVLNLFGSVYREDDVNEQYEKLHSLDPELVDELFNFVTENNTALPRHSVQINCSLWGKGDTTVEENAEKMRKLLITVQSMSDVITNSSSELFVVNSSNVTKSVLEEIINHDYAGDECSGMGGEADVLTFDFYRILAYWISTVLIVDEEVSLYPEWQYNQDEKASEDFLKAQQPRIKALVLQYFDEEKVKRIEKLYRAYHEIPGGNTIFVVDIDWNRKATINKLIRNYGAKYLEDA